MKCVKKQKRKHFSACHFLVAPMADIRNLVSADCDLFSPLIVQVSLPHNPLGTVIVL